MNTYDTAYPGSMMPRGDRGTYLDRNDHVSLAEALLEAIAEKGRCIADLEFAHQQLGIIAQERGAKIDELKAKLEPDMFWNDADPEMASSSIYDVVNDAFNDGTVNAGDVMTIQQAVRMENIQVKLIQDPENPDDSIEYEVVTSTATMAESV